MSTTTYYVFIEKNHYCLVGKNNNTTTKQEEAHVPHFAHLSKTALSADAMQHFPSPSIGTATGHKFDPAVKKVNGKSV